MALSRLKNILFGSGRLEAPKAHAARIIELCLENELSYEKTEFCDDKIILNTSQSKAKKLSLLLEAQGIEHSIEESGLPLFLSRYKARWGLIAGFFIIAAMLFLSERYVWDIRISGSSQLSHAEIKAELAAAGFGIGTRIDERDVDEIANELLLTSEGISWLSINYNGNIAYVSVREKEMPKESKEDISSPANVIASRDGIIEYYRILRGKPEIQEGQSVRAGELLISGIIENSHGETRYDHAMGNVYAITNRSFLIKIPLEYDKKVLSGAVCTQKSVKFFSNSINIFKKGGNLGATCDKIIEEDPISFFGLSPLPFSIVSEMTSEYKTVKERRSEAEASELAFFELRNLILSELCDAELLRKSISTEINENELILKCDIICLENIAVSAPIGKEMNN